MKDKWIILHNCPSPEPAWWDDKDKPVLFDTQKEAQTKMLEDYVDLVQRQLDEFKNGFREFDEVDTELDEWVEPCTVHEDGVITTETMEFDPKTFIR